MKEKKSFSFSLLWKLCKKKNKIEKNAQKKCAKWKCPLMKKRKKKVIFLWFKNVGEFLSHNSLCYFVFKKGWKITRRIRIQCMLLDIHFSCKKWGIFFLYFLLHCTWELTCVLHGYYKAIKKYPIQAGLLNWCL